MYSTWAWVIPGPFWKDHAQALQRWHLVHGEPGTSSGSRYSKASRPLMLSTSATDRRKSCLALYRTPD